MNGIMCPGRPFKHKITHIVLRNMSAAECSAITLRQYSTALDQKVY